MIKMRINKEEELVKTEVSGVNAVDALDELANGAFHITASIMSTLAEEMEDCKELAEATIETIAILAKDVLAKAVDLALEDSKREINGKANEEDKHGK